MFNWSSSRLHLRGEVNESISIRKLYINESISYKYDNYKKTKRMYERLL